MTIERLKRRCFLKLTFLVKPVFKNLLIRIKKCRRTFIPALYNYTFTMLRMVPQSAKVFTNIKFRSPPT